MVLILVLMRHEHCQVALCQAPGCFMVTRKPVSDWLYDTEITSSSLSVYVIIIVKCVCNNNGGGLAGQRYR
jgi:hypothetical protein